jgi:hypothetical protein
MLEVYRAVESAAAPGAMTSNERDISLYTDTDQRRMRVERRRQESIGLIDKNRQFPGFFVKKRLPVGGGWSDDVVTFFVYFDSEVFPTQAETFATKSRSEKFRRRKIEGWQGST